MFDCFNIEICDAAKFEFEFEFRIKLFHNCMNF